MSALPVLVIGAGMYVSGRGTSGFGTVMPTLLAAQRRGEVGEIHIAATSAESIRLLSDKYHALCRLLDWSGRVFLYPEQGQDALAYRQALARIPRPAAAIISVPDHLHHAITLDVIAAGLHPLVVKPLTPTLAEAVALIAALKKGNLYGAVEFHKRFDEANRLIRQAVRENRLGTLRQVDVAYSQRRRIRDVFSAWVDRTNIFQYLGVHYADLVHYISGAHPLRIMAIAQGSDAIHTVAEWETPGSQALFTSAITTHWIDPNSTSAMSDQKITLIGSQGRIDSDQKNRGLQLVTEAGGIEDINPYFSQFYGDDDGRMAIHGYGPASIRRFIADVHDIVAGRRSPAELTLLRPSFESALAATTVVEGVNRSLAEGSRWIMASAIWDQAEKARER
jgi:D-galacturonate reductase